MTREGGGNGRFPTPCSLDDLLAPTPILILDDQPNRKSILQHREQGVDLGERMSQVRSEGNIRCLTAEMWGGWRAVQGEACQEITMTLKMR